MALEVALQHRLKLRVAAPLLNMVGQSISNDIAHSGLFNLRDGPHLVDEFPV